jgi:hypothetical protein
LPIGQIRPPATPVVDASRILLEALALGVFFHRDDDTTVLA